MPRVSAEIAHDAHGATFRVFDNHALDFLPRPKATGLDFVGIDLWMEIASQPVHPDKFPAGVSTGSDLETPRQVLRQYVQAEFFAQLAHRARVVGFAGLEVTGGAGVETEREGIFGRGAFLDEDFSQRIE